MNRLPILLHVLIIILIHFHLLVPLLSDQIRNNCLMLLPNSNGSFVSEQRELSRIIDKRVEEHVLKLKYSIRKLDL